LKTVTENVDQVMSEIDKSSSVCIAKFLYNAFELRNINI